MSSCRSSTWRRFLHRWTPFLFKVCPGGNYHWRWDRYCFCRRHEHCGDWHGGVWHFKEQREV